MCVCSVIVGFNDGISNVLSVMELYGLSEGHFSNEYCKRKDDQRIHEMNRKSMDSTKSARKRKRAIRKVFGDNDKEVCLRSLYLCRRGNFD